MKVSQEYVAAGASHTPSCSAGSSTGILAYGAGRIAALWDTEDSHDRGVYATLGGHQGEITKIKLFSEVDGRASFISGDSTGEVRLWQQGTAGREFSCAASFKAHPSESVSALGVGPRGGSLAGHVVVGCADGSAKLWRIDEGQAVELQSLDSKGKLPLDFEMAYLPGSANAVLAVGCTDKRIQLWTYSSGKFEYTTMLEGHENWIRALSFTRTPSLRPSTSSSRSEDLLLASGSQDNYIRLWRIATAPPPQSSAGGLGALDELERKLGEGSTLSTRAHVLTARDGDRVSYYNVTLDALLVGHESGVTNVHWRPQATQTSRRPPSTNLPPLLSTSMDNSMVIWTPSSAGIWIPEHRFGSLGGGHKLGLFGAAWGTNGKSVCCSGWTGGWERWTESTEGVWDVRPGVSGHFGEVKSVAWDQNGDYLLSVSSDQTSRIHAAIPSEAGPSTWAEIARPQIHGYDMTDASFISPLRFVSTADEKVARVFDAPGGFVESLGSLGVVQDVGDTASRPRGATVPPLGLSNRAMGKEAAALDLPANRVPHEARDAVSQTLREKPTEEVLTMSTLWPEVEKVYGHGYELVTLATSHDGSLVATACKASNAEHAVVRINSTSTWDEIGDPLSGHSLTVTRIAFSYDDQLILTCSRDRSWRLFKRSENGYVPWAKEDKAHSRMMLDSCWIGERSFATASRDKTVKLWTLSGSAAQLSHTIKLNDTATAVNYARGLLAVGMESGSIDIYKGSEDGGSNLEQSHKLDPSISHVGSINRLAWSPKKNLLASCSDDKSLRIFQINEAG